MSNVLRSANFHCQCEEEKEMAEERTEREEMPFALTSAVYLPFSPW